MYDGWSPDLDDLTARRFFRVHRGGRRGWCCPPTGDCDMLRWARDYWTDTGRTPPGQAAAILMQGVQPGSLTAVDLRRIADNL